MLDALRIGAVHAHQLPHISAFTDAFGVVLFSVDLRSCLLLLLFALLGLLGREGLGLGAGVELVKNKETKESCDPGDGIGAYLCARAQEHGTIARAIGDTIAFSPPLIISESEMDEMFLRFEKALEDTTNHFSS